MSVSKTRPRVGVISIHPAPYRDPTFTAVHQRGVVDISVSTMFEQDAGHSYQKPVSLSYPNVFLGRGCRVRENVHFHPGILKWLHHQRFDVLLVPGYSHITSLVAMLYCKSMHIPFIFYSDGVLFSGNYRRWRPARNALIRLVLGNSAAVWVPGKASRAYMRHFGVPDEVIFEGAYCLDAEHLTGLIAQNQLGRETIRRELGIDNAKYMFLFAGRMIPERGLRFLAEAFSEVTRQRQQVYLLLIGMGSEQPMIEQCLATAGLSNFKILNPVPIEQIGAYYSAADAYVLSSLNETYSLALAYAAIAGLPMIATDRVGAVPDYVFGGETGHVVPSGDSQALAEAMLGLCGDRPKSEAMGRQAHEIAMRRTTEWAAMQLEAAVMTALGRNRDNEVGSEQPGSR